MKKILLVVIIALLATVSYADDAFVAKVNGTAITARALEETVDQLIPRSTFHGNVSENKRDELREKALNNLIEAELKYQDAVSWGIKPDKKQVKERMKQIRDKFESKKDYKKALEQAGLSEDQLKALIEKQVLVQAAVVKTVTEPSRMSDDALKEYYDKNTAKFKQPESVKIRLISSNDEVKAKEALTKIKAGEDFGDVAAKMSEDNYRIKGGDIGYIHRGRVLQEIEDEAFKLKVGELSGLIKADGTWFIIRVEDKKDSRQMTFEESKDKLKKELETKRAGELQEKWIGELRAKAKIEILWKPQGEDVKAEDRSQKLEVKSQTTVTVGK